MFVLTIGISRACSGPNQNLYGLTSYHCIWGLVKERFGKKRSDLVGVVDVQT